MSVTSPSAAQSALPSAPPPALPAPVARVAPPSEVVVYAPACIARPYDRSRMVGLLRVELMALGVSQVVIGQGPAPEAAPGGSSLAAVVLTPSTCEADMPEVTILVLDRASEKTVERRMTISDVALDERPRALAIGIAELLQASWAELELASPAARDARLPPALHAALAERLRPVSVEASVLAEQRITATLAERSRKDEAAARARAAQERLPSLDLGLVARAFPSRSTGLLGIAAEGRVQPAEHLVLRFGADVALGETDVQQGSVLVGTAAAAASAGWTTGGTTELELGPRLLGGYAWANGHGSTPDVKGSSYGDVFVLALAGATVRHHTQGRWTALLGVEVGYTLAGVSFLSDTSQAAGIGGAVLGLRTGLATSF
jgi:hypothetical protein